MTVKEAIAHLSTFPLDAVLVMDFHSELDTVEECDISLFKAEDKRVAMWQSRYMYYNPRNYEISGEPDFRTVVHFRGN